MTIRLMLVVALSLAACSSKLNPFGFLGGTRLTPKGYKHSNGATVVIGIKDSKLGSCRWVRSGDKIVCAPDANVAFSDAGCQTPVYVRYGCANYPMPTHASDGLLVFDSCDSVLPSMINLAVRPVGAETTLPATLYYRDSKGICASQGPPGANTRVFALGAPITASELVTGTVKSEAREGPLSVDYIEGSDGSAWWLDARDKTNGVCSFAALDEPSLDPKTVYCTPSNVAFTHPAPDGYTNDPACAGPANLGYTTGGDRQCTPAAVWVYGSAVMCVGYPVSLAEVGEVVASSSVRQKSNMQCETPTHIDGYSFFRVGATMDKSRFQKLTRARSDHKGLGVMQTKTAGGSLVQYADGTIFFDESGKRCYPLRFTDGRAVCAPDMTVSYSPGASGSAYFADAACMEPLVAVYSGSMCSTPLPIIVEYDAGDSTCGSSPIRVRALGTEHTGTPYFKIPGGACIEQMIGGTGTRYFRLGNDITSTLETLTLLE
ncbi:MAG: hypothetical protein IT381_01930 [Deltaproteobacteria bacterium]|nr:hypothetical protein [Deltaproteobacteria bacterium]